MRHIIYYVLDEEEEEEELVIVQQEATHSHQGSYWPIFKILIFIDPETHCKMCIRSSTLKDNCDSWVTTS